MRRWLLLAGATAGVIAAVSIFSQVTTASANVAFSLTGSVAGGVKSQTLGQQVTFVFTEKNTGTAATEDDMPLVSVTNATVEDQVCVLPNGAMFLPDGTQCEPGVLKPGQKSSEIVSVDVTGGPTASVKVCLITPVCKTLSVAA